MPSKNVHEAIVAVMTEVGYTQKERKQGLNYSFASEAALIRAIRPHMVEQGLYPYVAGISEVAHEEYTTKAGGVMQSTRLLAQVRFHHAPSDTYIDAFAVGEGADVGDKSANKAATAAYKYCLRQTFCIETGDDPDNTASDDQEKGGTAGNGKTTTLAQSGTRQSVIGTNSVPNAQTPPAPDWAERLRLLLNGNKITKSDLALPLGVEKVTVPVIESYLQNHSNLPDALAHLVGEAVAMKGGGGVPE
jgi:hypothetical protein